MTLKTRLAKLESVRHPSAIMIPHEQACRIQACFFDQFFPNFWRRAWRESFAERLRTDRLTEDDRWMIDEIPAKFRGEEVIRDNLLDAIQGAESLPGMWRRD